MTEHKLEEKDFNFVVTKQISSLDLHFDFRPQKPTITQPEMSTTTHHPMKTTTTIPSTLKPEGNSTAAPHHNSTTQRPNHTTSHSVTTTEHSNVTSTPRTHELPPKPVMESLSTPRTHELPPKPVMESLSDSVTQRHNRSLYADSPIGYEVPCGIRRYSNKDTQKIVNGSDAEMGEFPWLVSIQLKTGFTWRHICGGAVISRNYVITAGHCVYKLPVDSLSVVAGDYNLYKQEGHEQRSDVVRVQGLKGFALESFTQDIALLQLEPYLRMDGTWVAPICLPSPKRHFPAGKRGLVAGWGRLSEGGSLPQVLQRTSIPIMDYERCKELYSKSGYSRFLHSCQICSGWEFGGSDSCQGDSGGPLACEGEDERYYLCGVVSWGIGCARPKFPGVYTDVSCYSQWIADLLYIKPSALAHSFDLS